MFVLLLVHSLSKKFVLVFLGREKSSFDVELMDANGVYSDEKISIILNRTP